MASPAAILSILVEANTGKATSSLSGMQKQLERTNAHVTTLGSSSKAASGHVQTIGSSARRSTPSLKGLASAALAAGGAFAAFSAAKDAVQTTLELAAATQKLTAITGLDAKTASTWIEVFKVRNVQTKQVSMAFITLSKNMRNAAGGSATAVKAFNELGISQQAIKNSSTEETLLKIADGLKNIKSPAERAAIAQQLFGRGAQALIPVLVQGRQGVEDLLAAAQRYGAFLPNNVKTFQAAVVAQRALNLAMDGLKITFTQAVLPMLVAGAQALLNFIAQIRSGTGFGGQFASAISTAFNVAKTAVVGLVNMVGGLHNFLIALQAILAVFVAFKTVSAIMATVALAMNPMLLVAAALAAAAYLIIRNWATVGPFLQNLWNSVRATAVPVIQWITTAWQNAAYWVTTAWRNASNALGPTIRNLGIIFSAVFGLISRVMTPVIGTMGAVARAIGTVLVPAFHFALSTAQNVWNTIKGVVQGAFNVIRGIIAVFAGLFSGDFTKMWNGIKQIFRGAVQALVAIVKGVWNQMFNAGKFILGAIGSGIKAIANSVMDILKGFIETLLTPINIVLHAIGVGEIHPFGGGGGKKSGVGRAITTTSQRGLGAHATGGVVKTPGYFAGEEAPRYPEVILATNPAYRKRNLGLFAEAGKMLGVPGFAQGGVASTRQAVDAAAHRHGVPTNILWGVFGMETAFGSNISTSSAGAMGAFQFIPSTAARFGYPMTNSPSPDQFGQQADIAALYLSQLFGRNHSWDAALRAYSGGGYGLPQVTAKAEGGGGVLSSILGVFGGVLKTMIPGLGMVLDAAEATAKLTGMLPKVPKLPGFLEHLPQFMLDKATSFIKDKASSLFGGVSGAPGGPKGVSVYQGIQVANWVIGALQYAASKGVRFRITSGYRPGHDPHTASGLSEHQGAQYPHGAVDFGGYHDSAALAQKMAVVNATRDFKWPLLAPIGFVDDGHASGTGHKMGGIVGRYAGKFGTGGAVTASQPTLALFGERGAETAFFVPRFQTGGTWRTWPKNIPPSAAFSAWMGQAGGGTTATGGGGGGVPTALTEGWRSLLGIPALPKMAGGGGEYARRGTADHRTHLRAESPNRRSRQRALGARLLFPSPRGISDRLGGG